ncbi:radial spoke head protein 3 homolog B-like [Trichosurus vulpecula]|uniref:radial spoke head protein 3 homolog B-like n=1 Tax=Trichosurus vulpecula TaxID=9337 RepID=UPI00186B303F|nr:radial spoke head protein 3 homolog B-like [Trichosurus vulpecula]
MNSTVAKSGSKASGTYTFSSPPRALACQRRRQYYRDYFGSSDEKPPRYGNIMQDKRVIRGNTHALHSYQPFSQLIFQPISQADPVELQKQQEPKRKVLARKRAKEHLQPKTPEPVEGRKHVSVQTEVYVEELADRVIQKNKECQTDAFLNRPPTPLFIPVKIGQDAATQIFEGELFNFDAEVQPMLEVLLGRIIEQALVEVLEEEELAEILLRQQEFEELRNMARAAVQRLEEQDKRLQKEKDNRRQQHLAATRRKREASHKIAAHIYAKTYLADLVPCVFDNLRDSGYFYDPIERDIEIGFLPWLMNEAGKKIEYNMVGRAVLDMLIGEAVENRLNMFEQLRVKQTKNFPDESDKERKESLKTGAEPVIEDVKPQDSQQTNGSLKKKPTVEKKQSRKKEDKKKSIGKVPSDMKPSDSQTIK